MSNLSVKPIHLPGAGCLSAARPHLFARLALILGFAALAPATVPAAPVTWSPAVTATADTDVYSNGVSLYAYCGTATTNNGVIFTAVNSGTTWGSVTLTGLGSYYQNTFGFAGAPYSGLSTSYSNILSGAAAGGTAAGSATLNGLTPGHDYAVQIWADDSRNNSGVYTRNETLTSTNGNSVTVAFNAAQAAGGVGQYAVGYFVADSTSQFIKMTPAGGSSASVQVNAINVRDLGLSTKTWVGATSTSWGAAGNWNPSITPLPGDSLIFNNTSTANLATVLDTSYTIGSLTLSNTAAPVTIGPLGSDGYILTSIAGINLVGANQNLTINDPVALSAGQTWNVATSGSTVAVNGGISGSAALTITGAGSVVLGSSATYTGNTVVSGGNFTVNSGGSISSYTANISVTNSGSLINSNSITSASLSVATGSSLADYGSINVANTSVSGGSLAEYGTLNSPGISVASGGGIAVAGTLNTTNINLAAGSTLALIGSGYITGGATLTLAGGATVNASAASASYSFSSDNLINSSAGVVFNGASDCSSATLSMLYDGVNPPFIQTNGTLTISSGTTITVNNTNSVLLVGSYTLIAAATAGNVGSVTGSLPTVAVTGNGAVGPVSLAIDTAGDLQLVVGSPDIWTGASDNTWENGGNWTGGNVGGPAANPLDPVLFNNLSAANLNTTMSSSIVVNQLTVLNPPAAVSIGGSGTLEIGQGGISMQLASQNLTISAALQVPNNASWNIATNRTLNINGGVSGGGGPNIVGAGTVNLNSASTVSATTTVSGGSTLNLGAPNVLSVYSDTTVNGLMNLQGNSQAMGGLTGSGVVDNTSASAVILTNGVNNDSTVFNGVIKNSGGGALALQVNGGNLTLNSSNNTYSGGTTFNAGTYLWFPAATATYGTGPVTFNPGAGTYTSACTLTNALFLNSCYLHVGGANDNVQTWSGPVTVTGGFQMSGDGGTWSVTLSGPMNIGTGGISITNAGGNGTQEGYNISLYGDAITGPISGSGGITYYVNGGSSRLTVQGANTYTGGTIVNGTGNGKLNVWNAVNPFSTGPVTLNAGAIIEAAPGNGTVTNALTLNGGILQSEPQYNNYNTLTWTGPITMTADSAVCQNGGGNSGVGSDDQSSGVNINGPINIGGFTLSSFGNHSFYGGNTINGSISGTGFVQVTNNVLQLNGSNTFTGTFRSVGGTLGVGNVYALQNATLDMNAADAGAVSIGANAIIGALQGTRNMSLGAGTVSIGNNNAGTTYSGLLTGNSLSKIGTGTLTLSSNAYTGNTTVTGGTLSIAQTNLAFGSTVTVASGAALNLNYVGTNIVSALVLNGVTKPNGIYTSGNSGGLLTGTGAIQVGVTPDVWTGGFSTEWSLNTIASPKNWTSNSVAADFIAGNAVLFDDTLKSNNTVNISVANVSPIGVTFNNINTNYTIGGNFGIAGTAAIFKNGAGSVTLNTTNTYTGNTIINSNRLTIGGAGKLGNGTYAGGIYLNAGATLEYSSSAGQTFSGPITGAGGLLKDGPTKSDLTLSGTLNTYTGQTVITNGRVFVTAAGNIGGGTTIVQTNQGQLYVNGNANYSNPLNISSSGYSEGDANNNFDGAVRVDTSATLSGPVTLSGNARFANYAASGVTITISGQISGNYSLDFYGMNNGANSRTFLLSNPGNNFTGNANIFCNDYSTARTGASTTLQLGASGVIPSGNGFGNVVFNGADANHLTILELNGFNQTLNGVSNVNAAGAIIRNTGTGASTLTIGAGNTNSTFSGVITDGGAGSGKTLGITKIGTGKTSLTGLNSYNGNTTVSAGTLAIGQATLPFGATVSVAGGAVLELDYPGVNLVSTLVLNGVTQAPGTYNSGNAGGLITGVGSILVGSRTTWSGAFSSEWSINTLTSPKNWLLSGSASDYANGNGVLFDDTLTGSSLVNLSVANVTPSIVTFNNSKTNYTLQGTAGIAGSTSFTKNGTATVAILNANSYTGGTFVSAGVLEADNNSALGTGSVTMIGGALSNNVSATLANPVNLGAAATIGVRSGQALTLNGAVTNSGGMSIVGGGTVVYAGTNTYTGGTVINGGSTLKFTGPASSSFPAAGAIYVNNSGTTGTIDLGGSNQTSTAYVSFPYNSTTTLTNGTLTDYAAATGVPSGNEDYNFMGTINVASNANYISNKRFIIGFHYNAFTTTINGAGTNGSLTWGGDNNANENYIGVAAGDAATLNVNGGTVNFNNASTGTGNGYLNVGANSATSKGTININGGNFNVGTWMKLGGTYNTVTGQSGTAILAVTNGTVAIGGGSDTVYNGVLFMDGGNGDSTANTGVSTLTLSNATLTVAQIQAGNNGTKTINLNGGTLNAGLGASNLFLSAATSLTVNVQNGGVTINSGTNNINILAALVANGAGGLTKTGAGTLTLSGANTYTGGTVVSGGTLLITNASISTGTGAININAGGTLGGTGTIAGVVTNNAGGILAPGVAGSGSFGLTNKLVLLAGSTNTFAVNGTTPANTSVTVGSSVTYGGVLNIVTNGTFTIGQTFTLFSGPGAANTGNFASIAGSPGAGKAFSFTNGVLSVVAGGPILTSVTPSAVAGSSYAVTIGLTGSGFTGATAVLLTNVSASAGASYVPTVNSDTSISVGFVPGTAATTWSATVVNVTPSAPVAFTVTVPAKVTINTGNLNSAGAGKLVLSGTGGVAGNSYAVVSATNLNPPVVWTPVVTNKFTAGGNFGYTNTVNPGTPSLFLGIQQ